MGRKRTKKSGAGNRSGSTKADQRRRKGGAPTSSLDVNGNLRIVEREVADTKKTSSDAQETKTTVYLADGNGGFTPSRQTQELQERGADSKVEVKTTTLFPGANGNWELLEVKEKTIKEEGKNRISEESVSRPNPEGRLSEVSRTVGEETENAAGKKAIQSRPILSRHREYLWTAACI